jgi:hypothetical protein
MNDQPQPSSDDTPAEAAKRVVGYNGKTPAPTKPTKAPKLMPTAFSKSAKLKAFLKEKLTQKEFIIGSIVFVLLLASAIAFGLSNRAAAPKPAPVAVTKPAPVIITSPLTGLVVTAAQAKRPVTGVMIENSDFARPQSGLREAGVVFEGIAEAGITRFLALYQEATPANIGPIRSARPYFLDWALGFDAPLAHVGGSPQALADIKAWHVKNLDQFYNAAYYHRISSREAPHNVYTNMAKLNALEKTKGWTTSKFMGFARIKDSPSKNPTATSIDFAISSEDFHVHYIYDAKANAYPRFEGGAKHLDATTGRQLEPHVVIALVIPYKLEPDGYHSDYATLGNGKMYIFQDGTVTIGTWKKSTAHSQFQFLDANNHPIKLNPGQTWITAVGLASDVSYHGPAATTSKP